METEIIHGQIVAKANHYQAVPGKAGERRIIKDEVIRAYERASWSNVRSIATGVYPHVSGSLSGYGIVRLGSTWIIA